LRAVRVLLLIVGLVGAFALSARADDFDGDRLSDEILHSVEKQTFALVNQERASQDLPVLAWSDAIAREARGHSHEMASGDVDFGHDGFSERVDRLKLSLAGFRGAGENVLMTSDLHDVAQEAVTIWLHSPHHLKNIRGDYNYSAVGVWQAKDGSLYFTQIFIKAETMSAKANAPTEPETDSVFGLLTPPQVRARP
jgi:uncharacterized protein YkwD